MEDETYTPTQSKRGRKAGTPDTVKIPIKKLLEMGGDRLVVQVNRKWLENLAELYSMEGAEAIPSMVEPDAAHEEPAPLVFQVEDNL